MSEVGDERFDTRRADSFYLSLALSVCQFQDYAIGGQSTFLLY